MSIKKPFYITTTLPYVNADPHIGHAVEFIRADVIARWMKLNGHEVFMNTGTDEHGAKIHKAAIAHSIDTQAYVDAKAARFRELLPALGIFPEVNFIRTTDPHHIKAAQAFWQLVKENGEQASDGPYIYKKNYSIKYCVGCELEKTESELVDGKCPLHPLQEIELISEENYFFKFSAFQKRLLDLYQGTGTYEGKQLRIVPEGRMNEIRSFVERGLEDFSISRVASKMPWGVAVPGDPDQVMYVWFDALVDYISAIGWPDDEVKGQSVPGSFDKWWNQSGGVVQYCGKDNLRQQAAMLQAMLMAAGLNPSQTIVIDGFVTGDGGVKMSKSLGNTIDPFEMVTEYGTDALRYYVLRELHPFEDSPFTKERFKEAYNANLANGIGNLTSRIMKLSEQHIDTAVVAVSQKVPDDYISAFINFDLQRVSHIVWQHIGELDAFIQDKQPFKVIKEDKEKGVELIQHMVSELGHIAYLLRPLLPETANKIELCIKTNKMPKESLFMRK